MNIHNDTHVPYRCLGLHISNTNVLCLWHLPDTPTSHLRKQHHPKHAHTGLVPMDGRQKIDMDTTQNCLRDPGPQGDVQARPMLADIELYTFVPHHQMEQ